jgi:hypothetical protein
MEKVIVQGVEKPEILDLVLEYSVCLKSGKTLVGLLQGCKHEFDID